MGVFDMVVIVTFIGCATGVLAIYFKTKSDAARRMPNLDIDKVLDRLDDIEERMRVVEKIITDDRSQLSQRIDEL
jgi:hypothetical protein